MKRCVLLFLILLTSFYPTTGHSGDSSPLLTTSHIEYESSTGISSNTSHHMILANEMPPSETIEPQTKKAVLTKAKDTMDRKDEEVVEPLEKSEQFVKPSEDDYELDEDYEEFLEDTDTINDPLQGFNRAMFKFNDKLYYWFLKPVSRGYGFILPKKVRIGVRNFFINADMPVRVLNCLLQGRMKGVGIELSRFVINTTVGVAGLFNPASSLCKLEIQEADFDQTLGVYRMKSVFYLHWPIFGASSVRGTLGLIGDTFMRPTTYLVDLPIMVGVRTYDLVNETSLTIGDYETLTEPALDPYIAVRNAYYQNRESKLQAE